MGNSVWNQIARFVVLVRKDIKDSVVRQGMRILVESLAERKKRARSA